MTTIDPSGRLAIYLREQAQRLQSSPSLQSKARAFGKQSAKPEDGAARLMRNIAAIDKDDPQRSRNVFRAYLESVLLQEFGAALATDPVFGELLDRVQNTMEIDPALKQSMEQASLALLEKYTRTP